MAVEDSNGRPEGQNAKFPIGMSVLAVDDDPVCLKILEKYLYICKYKVTATNEGRTALEMLRQNKHVYDLLIVNVHMPDIDGFKLLELVGLELDLPVIMLSANGETDTVMRGIKHGACDYLLKPVGLKEISVVWKHVVMRRSKKRNNNGSNNNNIIIPNNTIGTGVLVASAQLVINNNNNNNNNSGRTRSINNNNRNGHKRRVLEEEFVDDEESDEPLKKQRVIWSPDLHRKFVEAINDLGIDKAVPKKILEKMSVDELTRENVASHLQKYRLYLKRMKEMPIQHANLLQAGFGSRNSQYIHLTSLESFKNYHVSGRYRQYIPATSSGYSINRSTATSASSLPNLIPTPIPSGGYGTNVSNNNNNGTMGSNYNNINNINNINSVNNVNNQPSMFVAGTATSTYSFQYTQTQSNNGINYNYPSLPVPPVAQITNLPFGASHISPMVMGTNGNLTGQNYTSGTGDELQQVVASFNNNMHNNHNNSALNSNFSALFNPIANMNNSYVPVGTNGEMGFRTGNVTGTGGLVPDQLSSSNNGSGLDNVDDLLAILKPMDGSGEAPFMDDMLPN